MYLLDYSIAFSLHLYKPVASSRCACCVSMIPGRICGDGMGFCQCRFPLFQFWRSGYQTEDEELTDWWWWCFVMILFFFNSLAAFIGTTYNSPFFFSRFTTTTRKSPEKKSTKRYNNGHTEQKGKSFRPRSKNITSILGTLHKKLSQDGNTTLLSSGNVLLKLT